MYKLLFFGAVVAAGVSLFKFLKKGKNDVSETITPEQEQSAAA
jgi:hypothetical protein